MKKRATPSLYLLQCCVYLAFQDSYLYNYLSDVSQPVGGCLQLPLGAKSAAIQCRKNYLI